MFKKYTAIIIFTILTYITFNFIIQKQKIDKLGLILYMNLSILINFLFINIFISYI